MLKRTIYLLMMATLVFSMQACKSESSGSVKLGTMKMKLNNANWEAANATGTNVSASGISIFTATGVKITNLATGENETLVVTVYGTSGGITTGTYNVTDSAVNSGQINFSTYQGGTRIDYFAVSGQVVISKISGDEYEGSFSGVLNPVSSEGGEERTITDGQFKVSIGQSFGF